MDFAKEYSRYKELVEKYLAVTVDDIKSLDDTLLEAVKYALLGGGKRLRPVMFLAIFDFFTFDKAESQAIHPVSFPRPNKEKSEPIIYPYQKVAEPKHALKQSMPHQSQIRLLTVAIEMLHTYTLVHDDLPCLDNDDFRRGNPSCHKKFGEATALLAGDSLLNLTYEMMFLATATDSRVAKGAAHFSALCGIKGLIGGQAAEMRLSKSKCANSDGNVFSVNGSERKYLDIYQNKTAALFEASAIMATTCCKCDDKSTNLIRAFAKNFGMAFQLKDDIADMNKGSFADIFGKNRAQQLLNSYSQKALEAAAALEFDFLAKMVNFDKYI